MEIKFETAAKCLVELSKYKGCLPEGVELRYEDVLLCNDEKATNAFADFLEGQGFDVTTGYYDPKEDEESGLVDSCTGWYYIDC